MDSGTGRILRPPGPQVPARPLPRVRAIPIDWPQPAEIHSFMDYRQFITIDPGKRSGQPCIRGLRITVQDVLEYLASGMSMEQIVRDFPDLTIDDIRACLAFAADRERRLRELPGTAPAP